MDNIILIILIIYTVAVVAIVLILSFLQKSKNRKYKKHLEELEYEKNTIDSAPIMPELSKIESYLKNDKLEAMYQEWRTRLEDIKEKQIPEVTDMLLEADYSLSKMDYKSTLYKIAKLEMQLYKVKANSEFLLSEIKEITTSEERNRAIITKLKAKYRELYKRYTDDKASYGDLQTCVTLQFENIAKRFEDFETVMEANEYTEVTQIIKAIDDMLKHMSIVVTELPDIILLATSLLPKKIVEVKTTYDQMVKQGYPLDYLNVEYNIEEANKKISDIMDRANVLNLEDSLFELKVLVDYFESIFNDFEKEDVDRSTYEEANEAFREKLEKINKLVGDIFSQLDELRTVYNLSQADVNLLNEIKSELAVLNNDYKILMTHTGNHTFAYSKLIKEIETLVLRLANIEENLDGSLDSIGTMKEDEVRARQQLEEVKVILREAKSKIRDYNLPVIPRSYYVELKEAGAAIKEIVIELDKKPITISTLNTRVDTARDLVLKLFSTTKEMMKTAMFAEMAIVYGNRYRTSVDGLDSNLTYAEMLFYKGEYQKSLELTINCLNRIEPGIYDKLISFYGDQK